MSLKLAFRPAAQGLKNVVRSFFWRLGCREKGVRIAGGVMLKRVTCGPYVNIAHHAEVADAELGKRTSVGRYTKIRDASIGSYCSISWDVTIGAVSHPMNRPSSHAFSYRSQFGIIECDESLSGERVTVGNDVWIGCGAIVMPGLTIGDGAVIGAGAVVTKDIEPYAIVSGVPAKLMRYRFDGETVDALESLRWWDWDDSTLKARIPFFKAPLSSEALEKLVKENR